MQCEEVREYLADRLAGSLSDRLSGAVHSYVRTHMLSCPECCDEMEHFEEIQTVLRSIPLEPCDSNAMHARFDLLMGAKKTKEPLIPAVRRRPRTRPLKIFLSIVVATAVLAFAVPGVRQVRSWISATREAPPVPSETAKPAVATVRSDKIAPPVVPSEMANVSGRVFLEDGSDISDAPSLGEIAMSPVGSSGSTAATIVKLDANGRFSRSFAAGEYRFRVAVFSQDFVIRSISAGAADLLKENLTVSGDSPIAVEIRVAGRSDIGTGRILGTVVDGVTNAPSQADRVVLCCFASEPAERVSTPVRPDGTFEFIGVPSGQYTAELRGTTNLVVANPALNVTSAGVSGVELFTASQLVTIDVNLRLDTGDRLPYKPDTSIVFTGTNETFRVVASSIVGSLFRASVPANSTYAVTVSNIAAGYAIQSIVDGRMTDLMNGGLFTAPASTGASARIVITLSRN